jgi:hypothetical protein
MHPSGHVTEQEWDRNAPVFEDFDRKANCGVLASDDGVGRRPMSHGVNPASGKPTLVWHLLRTRPSGSEFRVLGYLSQRVGPWLELGSARRLHEAAKDRLLPRRSREQPLVLASRGHGHIVSGACEERPELLIIR